MSTDRPGSTGKTAQAASKAMRPSGPTRASNAPRTLDSAKLFLGQSLVLIRHMDEIYSLQITRQGKLILTK